MSSKEFLSTTKEALSYCKENNLLMREDLNNPNQQQLANKAIHLMELHKSHQEQSK